MDKQNLNDIKLPPKPVLDPFRIKLTPEMMIPATKEEREQLVMMRESTTYWKDAFRRLKANKVAMVSLGLIVVIFLFAFIGPLLMPYSYDQQIRGHERLAPVVNSEFFHPFGTDNLGRDLCVRVMIGTRISLVIGVVSTFFIVVIGVLYGAISGFIGGTVDMIMMRICEIIYSIPTVLIIILLNIVLKEPLQRLFDQGHLAALSSVGTGLICIFVTFALLYWVSMARMVRGEILALKNCEYVTASRALGAAPCAQLHRHRGGDDHVPDPVVHIHRVLSQLHRPWRQRPDGFPGLSGQRRAQRLPDRALPPVHPGGGAGADHTGHEPAGRRPARRAGPQDAQLKEVPA